MLRRRCPFLWNDNLGSLEWGLRLLVAAALSVAAVAIAASRQRRERRLAQMTLIAETAQRAVLRTLPSSVGDVGFAARYVSAAEEARIGGDLYEVVSTRHGTRAIVGDVKGKGLRRCSWPLLCSVRSDEQRRQCPT